MNADFDYHAMLLDPFIQRMMAFKYNSIFQVGKRHILYKYRSVDSPFFREEWMKLIKEKCAYFSSQEQLNDPMDCLPIIESGLDFEEYLDKLFPILQHIRINKAKTAVTLGNLPKYNLPNVLSKIINISEKEVREYFQNGFANDIIEEGIKKIAIFCLTGDNNNDVMWSMYANKGNGICIGISNWSEPKEKQSYSHPIRVIYTAERFVMNYKKAMTYFAFMQPGFLGGLDSKYHKIIKENITGVLYGLYKMKKWKYENEFRILNHSSSGYNELPYIRVERVYIGHKVSEENINWLIDSTKLISPNTTFYRSSLSRTSYGYDFQQIKK